MYPDVSQMYFLHVSQRNPRYIWDTYQIHQDTCIFLASSVSHWIHIRIHQDTCILDSSSRYIRIHRDTYPRMYPFVSDMYRECILCVMYLRVKLHCSATPPSQSDGSAPLGQQTTQTLWRGIFVHSWVHRSTCASKQLSTSRKLY